MDVVAELVPKLTELPGVHAVVLGGSRAQGTEGPDSDWDFGVYYRGTFDAQALARLGHPAHVAQPGEWGRIVNGGAWMSVLGQRVDVLLRDLDQVERWWNDARDGRFDVDNVPGHLAGLPTYTTIGELAVAKVLSGELPEVEFPERLREVAELRWRWNGAFSLLFAEQYLSKGRTAAALGSLGKAAMETAHGVVASRGVWVLNEKTLIARAGLGEADEIMAGGDAETMIGRMRELLGPPEVAGLHR
ncbi:MAG TPA: nucleotidyltransferase domain-containing protein [Pseudonocardia sp.]|nr:nucleotidyltransferase domain-containing protein [Pseudonocardia sp.]